MSPLILLGRLQGSLGLQRNIVVMLTATLLLGMGEELWVTIDAQLPFYVAFGSA